MGRRVVELDDDPRVRDSRQAEPPLGDAGAVCVAAWNELDSSRQMTAMTLGLAGSTLIKGDIEWSKVKEWCTYEGLGRDETRVVASVLRRLDADRARSEGARLQRLAQSTGR